MVLTPSTASRNLPSLRSVGLRGRWFSIRARGTNGIRLTLCGQGIDDATGCLARERQGNGRVFECGYRAELDSVAVR